MQHASPPRCDTIGDDGHPSKPADDHDEARPIGNQQSGFDTASHARMRDEHDRTLRWCSSKGVEFMAVTAPSRSITTTPFANGRSFGTAGAYTVTRGLAEFAVDPSAQANARIVDLALAARDASGLVHFDADFCLLEPADPGASSGRLCFVVNNRGRATAVPFSLGTRPVAATEIDPGDGYLLDPRVDDRVVRLAVGHARGAWPPRTSCAGGQA